MNLIQQFPDISAKIRSKTGVVDKKYRSANAKQSSGYIEHESVAQYYEGEFRRWHIKFLFILTASLGIFWVVLLKSFWFYNLINRG